MEELELILKDGKTSYRPGEEVIGRAQWRCLKSQSEITISLGWHTTGKGTEDYGRVEEIRLDRADMSGYRDFSFKLPESPYSFSGRLLSIVWSLELSGDKDSVQKEIIVSPSGREICGMANLEDLHKGNGGEKPAGLFSRFKRPEA